MNKTYKFFRYILPWVFIILVAAILLTRIATIEKAAEVISELPVWMVLLAALSQVISYLGSGYQIKALVKKGRRTSTVRGALITIAGESVGLAGGLAGSLAATYLWVARDEDMSDEGVLAGVIPLIYNSVVLIAFSAAGMAYLLLKHDLSNVQAIFYGLILAVLLAGILILVYGLFRQKKIEWLVVKSSALANRFLKKKLDLEKIKGRLDHFYRSLELVKAKGWVEVGIGTLVNVGFDIVTIYLFFLASGYGISAGVLIAGYCLSFLLGRSIFFIPGGSGVVEGGMVAIYMNLGVPGYISVVAALGYRFLSFWLPSLIGFAIMFYLQKDLDRHPKHNI
jgi:hypothetical protein